MRWFLKKNLLVLATLVLLILVLLWSFFYSSKKTDLKQESIKVVEARVALLEDIEQKVDLIGTFKPKQMAFLYAQFSGVLNFHVQPGEFVVKDTVLASLTDDGEELRYELALTAEGIAKEQYERAISLQDSMMMTKQAFEERKSTWIHAKKALSEAKREWDKLKIKAPFDGIVGSYSLSSGSSVRSGDKVAQFYDPKNLRVYFDVPSSILEYVHPGSKIEINQKTYPLTYVESMIQEETHMAKAYVDLDNQYVSKNIIGTTLVAQLTIKEGQNTLVIPRKAIFFQRGESFVYTIKADNSLEAQKVNIGLQDKEKIEILSGMEPGDVFVIQGQERLYPGMKVEVLRVDQKS